MPNKKKNQKCWNCDHFQRYDESEEPLSTYGECRKMPLNTQYGQVATQYVIGWWPFVGFGDVFWCSEWQHTTLTPPPIPEFPRKYQWPDTWEQWVPWNVKAPQNVMCWTCNHFQPLAPEQTRQGQCHKFTYAEVLEIDIGTPLAPMVLQGHKTPICGDVRWCGAWEKDEDETPPLPAAFCSDKPPSQPSAAVDDMTKAELIEYAGEKEIAINSSDTKAVILAAIKST